MNTQFICFRLKNSSPETVYSWLESNESESVWVDDREEIETELLQRNHPLINLGLAQYTLREAKSIRTTDFPPNGSTV